MKVYNARAIERLSDEIGEIQAQIADLEKRENEIKEKLTDVTGGYGTTEGRLFRVNVVTSLRKATAWKNVAMKMNPTRQLITANTTEKPVTTVKVTARRDEKKTAE